MSYNTIIDQGCEVTENIKLKAYRALIFILIGYGFSQVLRLGGNLVLTRLLAPELFGLMALAYVFHKGLGLFSDIGIEPGVVRSNRALDPVFLKTAWTIQFIRGLVLFALTAIIAYPVSLIYDGPILLLILPAIGLTSIFQGLQSCSLYLLNKDLNQGKLVFIDLVGQIISLAVMVVIAYVFRTIWALVIGGLIPPVIKAIWSLFLKPNTGMGFKLERTAVHELVSFGKWIFLSTAMMFLATQADRILLGKIFPFALFGVYNIAAMFAELPKEVMDSVGNRVLFPLLSKFIHLPHNELRDKIKSKRKYLLFPLILLIAGLVCLGDYLIIILYDQRYKDAAWILPMLAFGIWPFVLHLTVNRSLYAIGKPKFVALGDMVKFIYMIICVPLFFFFGGNFGAILAVALKDIPVYILVNIGLKKENLSMIRQDAWATVLLLSLIALGIGVRLLLDLGIPGMREANLLTLGINFLNMVKP